MPLLRVTNHQASFSSPQRLKPPLQVLRNSASMSFSTSDFTMNRKTCHMMATDNKLHHAPSQTKRSKQTCLCTTEFYPIQQTSNMMCTWEFSGGAFWNPTLRPDQWSHASRRSSSWCERDPMTTTFIRSANKLRRRSRSPPPCPGQQSQVTSCYRTNPKALACHQ
jgi:hypothetical protein